MSFFCLIEVVPAFFDFNCVFYVFVDGMSFLTVLTWIIIAFGTSLFNFNSAPLIILSNIKISQFTVRVITRK